MTLKEARKILDKAAYYVDIDKQGIACLDGVFNAEMLTAIQTIIAAKEAYYSFE